MYDVTKIRDDFPILSREVNGRPLVYLDNAASAQKPGRVIEAVSRAYEEEYANVHRGLHYLSNLATDKYEKVRSKIKSFLNARSEEEIIYTTGATEGMNLVAYSWAMPRVSAGDEIVLSVMEHHANIVPWHFLRERLGVVLRWAEPDGQGALDPQRVLELAGPRTKLIAISHMSNVLGTKVDVATIAREARKLDIPVLADGAQAAVHGKVDVQELGVDFYAITGHKLYGPSASGALFAKRERIEEMRPFRGGGDMIKSVTRSAVDYADPPRRFEAGTPPIVQMIGLGVAIDYISELGAENIHLHECELRDYAAKQLSNKNWLRLQGCAEGKGAIFSFTIDGAAHAHDLSTVLDKMGIAVRAGHHCAQPLMEHLGTTATCRASFGLYNTKDEVDKLVEGLEFCRELFA